MSTGCEKSLANAAHRRANIEDRDDSALRGDIQPPRLRIKRKDIWVRADLPRSHATHRPHIEPEKCAVVLACDERAANTRIDQKAMISRASRHRVSLEDRIRSWVDLDKLATGLHVSEDVVGDWIVLVVPDLASKGDRPDPLIGIGIDDRERSPVLVRDEETLLDRIERNPVREVAPGDTRDDAQRLFVDRDDLARSRGACVDGMVLGHCENPGYGANVDDRRNDASLARIDDHDVAVAHVGDEEQMTGRVERLIVQPRWPSGERDVGDRT